MNVHTDASALAQLKGKLTHRLGKRGQRGVTLVELSVAVAVMGLIMAGAMVGVPRLMNSVKLSQEMKDWQMSSLAVQNSVASGVLPVTANKDDILKLAIVEPFNRTGPGQLINRFGGSINIEGVGAGGYPSSGVKVESTGYPSAQCQEFAVKMIPTFATLEINGEKIKAKGVDTDLTKISEACKRKANAGTGGFDDMSQADLNFSIAG